MTRKEFIDLCAILGIGLPLTPTLLSCKSADDTDAPLGTNEKIIIIGAGVGGLTAGYLLKQRGIDFEILEASSQHGGRIRINTDFADFPIPLGAEWIETDLDIFETIVNDASVAINVSTFADAPDYKFLNGSWFQFFEHYVVPSISDKINYNTVVSAIDYSGDQIIVDTQHGQKMADKVIVSVPVQVLRDGDITFSPSLPQSKQDAINNVALWEGFKAFFEFSTHFYGDGQEFSIQPPSDGQKLYYDATFGQNSNKNILGLFVVGAPAHFILAELDGLFANQATPNYVNHITQNWNDEPFIKSGYVSDEADWRDVRALGTAVNNNIFFAGGAYTDGEDWVSVHAAALSAKTVVDAL